MGRAGIMMCRRVTVDVDGVNKWGSTVRMLSAYYNLMSYGARRIRVDLTRKGFHLVAWFRDPVDALYVRRLVGDDRRRILFDEQVGVSRQILFGVKGGFEVRKDIQVS